MGPEQFVTFNVSPQSLLQLAKDAQTVVPPFNSSHCARNHVTTPSGDWGAEKDVNVHPPSERFWVRVGA